MRPFASTISLEEARLLLTEHLRPITRTERVVLSDAGGRVAATDVASPVDVPPFARSAMDGYAVIAADVAAAAPDTPVRLRIADRIFTGQPSGYTVLSGSCAEIATGAPIPAGADAVVMVEETRRVDEHHVDIAATARAGQNIGRQGADIVTGDLVVRAGQALNASRLGAVAAVGALEVDVFARPRVALVSTGNEVIDPGQPLAARPDLRRQPLHARARSSARTAASPRPIGPPRTRSRAARHARCVRRRGHHRVLGRKLGRRSRSDGRPDRRAGSSCLPRHRRQARQAHALRAGQRRAVFRHAGQPDFMPVERLHPARAVPARHGAPADLRPRARSRVPLGRRIVSQAGRHQFYTVRVTRRRGASRLQGIGRHHEPLAGRWLHRDSL